MKYEISVVISHLTNVGTLINCVCVGGNWLYIPSKIVTQYILDCSTSAQEDTSFCKVIWDFIS